MPPIDAINTVAGAFVAGLATSLHCAGMCGPVACSLMSLKNGEDQQQVAAVRYHVGRMLSYGTLGAIAGALGRWPLTAVTDSPAVVLPWVLAGVLLVLALGMDTHLPKPKAWRMWMARTRLKLVRIPVKRGALALGLCTPLLPCGPLYLMLGIALVSGSAQKGAEFMLAFSLGTLPLLWLAQQQFQFWKNRVRPLTLSRVRRGVAFAGALMIVARLWGNLPAARSSDGGNPDAGAPQKIPEVTCPLCGNE